jgi:hypothetical protein
MMGLRRQRGDRCRGNVLAAIGMLALQDLLNFIGRAVSNTGTADINVASIAASTGRRWLLERTVS